MFVSVVIFGVFWFVGLVGICSYVLEWFLVVVSMKVFILEHIFIINNKGYGCCLIWGINKESFVCRNKTKRKRLIKEKWCFSKSRYFVYVFVVYENKKAQFFFASKDRKKRV